MFAVIASVHNILRRRHDVLDALLLSAIGVFLVSHFRPSMLLSHTHATGGDMPSHYYSLVYLKEKLLPHFRISGWTQSNYAGFPILENYFPVPFLIMVALSWVLPLTAAFKLGTVLGIWLLPFGAYLGLRAMRLEFPIPILGAIASLLFIFLESNSMWGGNTLSTLAGEFAYSYALVLTLVWIGTFYAGISSNKSVLLNSFLLACIGLCHGYPLLFCLALSSTFLLDRENYSRNFSYLAQVYALSFLLMGFWIVPLLARLPWTTAYDFSWPAQSLKVIYPVILWPAMLLAGVAYGRTPRRPWLYFLAAQACGWLLYGVAPKMGVVDIRFLPFVQITLCLMAAIGLTWLIRRLKGQGVALLMVLLGSFWWVGKNVQQLPSWIAWNYTGFEGKSLWPVFAKINDLVKGSVEDPRVVYEHSGRHNALGTVRAWECLPVFSGRSTLEHAYFQASPSAPFVFYVQSEISQETSCPFADYGCTTPDLDRAAGHLRLFNIKELIVISDAVKSAIRQNMNYQPVARVDPYEVYALTGPHHYVEPLVNQPALWTGGHWKQTAYTWFRNSRLNDVHLVFPTRLREADAAIFPLRSGDLLQIVRQTLPPAEPVLSERVSDAEITFETRSLHHPHLVKVSYHPGWKVEGADRIYLVSPAFMLVYPTAHRVRLYFARSTADYAGMALTLLGLGLAAWAWKRRRNQAWNLPRNSWVRRIWIGALMLAGLLWVYLISGALKARLSDPNTLIAKGVKFRDKKHWDQAESYFLRVINRNPVSGLAEHAQNYLATVKYLRGDWQAGLAEYGRLIQRFPEGPHTAEAYYHIAFCYENLHRPAERAKTVQLLLREFPHTPWAKYARDRWREAR